MSSAPLVPLITRAGLAAIRNAQGTGLLATISAIAVGRGVPAGGSYVGYEPAPTATALRGERARVPLLSGSQLGGVAGSAPIGFRVMAEVPPDPGTPYPINEVGVFLSDGTMLMVWSDPVYPLAYTSTLAAVDLAFDLFLEALPVDSLAITVTNPNIPDTTGILAGLLRDNTNLFIQTLAMNERMLARGII